MKVWTKIKCLGMGIVSGVGTFAADYTFSDLADITGDVTGQFLIETGDFTSLYVFLGVVLVAVGAWAALRRA